ncbi:MAG: glycosyltransferase family 39 protein [Polyangiaceae bacterium]
MLLVAAAYLAIRLVGITADPPPVPNGVSSVELLVEPVAKAHEARNWALFGEFQTNPVDNYQFWRPQSPVWVYSLAGWFRLMGVSYLQLRLFSVLVSLAGFFVFLAYAERRLQKVPLLGAGLFFGFNVFQIFYTRVGLLEPAVNTLIIVTAYLLLRAEKRPAWLAGALVAWAAAFLTKQTALFFLPVVLMVGVWLYVRALTRGGASRLDKWLPPLAFVAVFGGLAFYCSRPEYLRTAAWNLGHVVLGKAQHKTLSTEVIPWWEVLARPFTAERWTRRYFWLFPVAAVLSSVAVLGITKRLLQRRASLWEAIVWLWWGSSLGAVLLTTPEGNRFELIVYPSVALLAGEGLSILSAPIARRRWPRLAMVLSLAVCAGAGTYDGVHYVRGVSKRKYTVEKVNTDVEKAIGKGPAVVIGLWAGPSVFNTPYTYYYVKDNFNATRESLVALKVTHFLLFDKMDYTRGILTRHYPHMMRTIKKRKTFTILRSKISLYKPDKALK